MLPDLRETLPLAIKIGHTWSINGERFNFLRLTNKFGEECGCVRLKGREQLARFERSGRYFVGVFLHVANTERK